MHCRTLSNNCSKSFMKTKKYLFVQGNLDVYPHHVVDPSHKIAQQWEALPCAWLAFSWQLERPCAQHVFFPRCLKWSTAWQRASKYVETIKFNMSIASADFQAEMRPREVTYLLCCLVLWTWVVLGFARYRSPNQNLTLT